ncbi:MAG TPA: STAS domain-containing protein [Steroidobacteraceae bacterium]|nr:STAS domain-containing protein [Steroidobacteraceae bacterium]
MKTRKQKGPVSQRARHQTTKRGPARSRGKAASSMRRAGSRPRDDGTLTLGADCTVAEADELKSTLASRVAESGPVTLDVSALQRIDAAGLQLLAAFVRDRRAAGRTVAWYGRASTLETAAQLLGLHQMLELPAEGGR